VANDKSRRQATGPAAEAETAEKQGQGKEGVGEDGASKEGEAKEGEAEADVGGTATGVKVASFDLRKTERFAATGCLT